MAESIQRHGETSFGHEAGETPYKEFKYLEDVGFPRCEFGTCLQGTMLGWYQPTADGIVEMTAHWVTFGTMMAATFYLAHCTWRNRGPSGRHRWFSGYNELLNLSLYVNMFAAIGYFGKCVADYEVAPHRQHAAREWGLREGEGTRWRVRERARAREIERP